MQIANYYTCTMQAAIGVLTIHGGVTSHAAVVMRGMGKPAVTGANKLSMRAVAKDVEKEKEQVAVAGKSSEKAEVITFYH